LSVVARRRGAVVLESFVDALSWDGTLQRIGEWSSRRESRYVCACNVHSVVTGWRERNVNDALNRADMCTPDGAPIALALRAFGFTGQTRINGPDLMERLCNWAAETRTAVYLLGSTESTLQRLKERLEVCCPGLPVVGTHSPPFRAISAREDEDCVRQINASRAQIVFVGLGCPKQELWMASHRGRVQAVMIGVGAAFDFLAGTTPRAPRWMQRAGLEWLHRLWSEPRRLLGRYLVTNTLFVALMLWRILSRHVIPR